MDRLYSSDDAGAGDDPPTDLLRHDDIDIDIGQHPQERPLEAEQQHQRDEAEQGEVEHGSVLVRRFGAPFPAGGGIGRRLVIVQVAARDQDQRGKRHQAVSQRKGEDVDHRCGLAQQALTRR